MKVDTYPESIGDYTLSEISLLPQQTAVTTQPLVGQLIEDNFFEHSGEILGNFVESGQVWALLIGVVIGYIIRGMTTY